LKANCNNPNVEAFQSHLFATSICKLERFSKIAPILT
jgi:hypothetical protein